MPEYFEFEVSLCDIRPRIWRRFLIHRGATFMDLHEAIQEACGWGNCHLFVFRSPGRESIAGIPDNEFGEPDPDAQKVSLSSFFIEEGWKQCVYEYDFGDSWEHKVVLRRTVELPEKFERRLLDGRRAFPCEDCGGITGYQECVSIANGGKDPEELREWMGDWHPEEFDLEEAKLDFDRTVRSPQKRKSMKRTSR